MAGVDRLVVGPAGSGHLPLVFRSSPRLNAARGAASAVSPVRRAASNAPSTRIRHDDRQRRLQRRLPDGLPVECWCCRARMKVQVQVMAGTPSARCARPARAAPRAARDHAARVSARQGSTVHWMPAGHGAAGTGRVAARPGDGHGYAGDHPGDGDTADLSRRRGPKAEPPAAMSHITTLRPPRRATVSASGRWVLLC